MCSGCTSQACVQKFRREITLQVTTKDFFSFCGFYMAGTSLLTSPRTHMKRQASARTLLYRTRIGCGPHHMTPKPRKSHVCTRVILFFNQNCCPAFTRRVIIIDSFISSQEIRVGVLQKAFASCSLIIFDSFQTRF